MSVTKRFGTVLLLHDVYPESDAAWATIRNQEIELVLDHLRHSMTAWADAARQGVL